MLLAVHDAIEFLDKKTLALRLLGYHGCDSFYMDLPYYRTCGFVRSCGVIHYALAALIDLSFESKKFVLMQNQFNLAHVNNHGELAFITQRFDVNGPLASSPTRFEARRTIYRRIHVY